MQRLRFTNIACVALCCFAMSATSQEFREYVRPNAAPALSSAAYSHSYADQLTRNRHAPDAPPPMTEEMRNRMAMLSGIQRLFDNNDRRPHPESHQPESSSSVFYLTNDGKNRQIDNDLSRLAKTAGKSSWTLYGQDLTEKASRKDEAFAVRNLLFAKGMHGSGTGDMNGLETHPSAWQNANYGNFAYSNQPSPPKEPNDAAMSLDSHSVPSAAVAFEASVADGQSTNAPNVFLREPQNDAVDDFKALLANTRPPPNSGEFQRQAVDLPQQSVVPVAVDQPLPVGNQQLAFFVRGIDRFDTHLSRFATADPSRPGQVVLNPLNPILRGAVTVDDYIKRPTAILTGDRAPSSQIDYSSSVGVSTGVSVPDSRFSPVSGIQPGLPSQASFTGTRILNNPNVGGQLADGKTATPPPSIMPRGFCTTTAESPWNFTTYPDFRADLFPALENHVKEDLRPATGRRLGPQQRFGGGTNELKEDLDQRSAINDIRPAWAHPSEMGTLSAVVEPDPPALNQFASVVGIESLAQPPQHTAVGVPWRRIGDDLSISDQLGHIQYGRLTNAELTTRVPYQFGPETTTVIAVPLLSLSNANAREEVGPASRMIGSGFSPISAKIILTAPKESGIPRGYIREYHGPEEVTGSRYRNLDEHFNTDSGTGRGGGPQRYVKIELLNK